jgi:hypothetical protein
VRHPTRAQAAGVLAALLLLALLAGHASPGFPALAELPPVAAVRRVLHASLHPTPNLRGAPDLHASALALADIPIDYLASYQAAAPTCPTLTWQLLAGIGKVETNHGRDPNPGVHTGTNPAGAAGPMQFLAPTWARYGHGSPYDPHHAIPAAARLLCANGLQTPHPPDPCPTLTGSPQTHTALHAYNHACWYVRLVLTWATRYTPTPPPAPPATPDPFLAALLANPRLSVTTSAGCDPRPDLTGGRLDLRAQSLLGVLLGRWRLRLSCVHTGHSVYVAGTHRVSNHTLWRALDIDRVDGRPVTAANPAARALVGWLDGLRGPLRPVEVGSPWPIGHRPYFSDEGHQDHIHIGYAGPNL